ncbi:MAG: autotransporter outer membrane beta-barrel domain-containing protein [Methylococcales bacterium]|nr:autotransporter outer membrane beta-barrel domain-containing protein [Methylococcales bacterium]
MSLLHNLQSLRHSAVLIPYFFALSSANAAQLAATPGLTSLQSVTGAAIQSVCTGLAPTNKIASNPQSAQQDLFNQCNAMIQSGNQIQNNGPTRNSLGLSSAGLGSALQNVATEEMATPSKISTNTLSGQVSAINSHLFDLHYFNLGGGSGDEKGSLLSKRLGTFMNGVGGFGDIKATTQENAANFNNAGVLLGADYRITDHFLAGMAGGYTRISSDFLRSIDVAGGNINADVYNVSLFSTYDIKDFYVDGSFTYGWSNYDAKRSVVILSNNSSSTGGANRIASSNPNGDQYSAALGLGYNFHKAALIMSPIARVNYLHGQIDSYTEQGAYGLNLAVDKQKFESLQSSFGGQISYAFSQSFGVITPRTSFSWNHEFMNGSRNITARYSADPNFISFNAVTNSPDRDFAIFGAGVSSVLRGGVQLLFNYQTLLGYNRVTSHGFTAGARLEF